MGRAADQADHIVQRYLDRLEEQGLQVNSQAVLEDTLDHLMESEGVGWLTRQLALRRAKSTKRFHMRVMDR